MAKDINKILKTIEHFGEGTFDDIDQIVQSEQSIVSSIDKEILTDITGEESSLDIDIDSLLGDELKSISPAVPEEVEEQEPIPEEKIELETAEELPVEAEIKPEEFSFERLGEELIEEKPEKPEEKKKKSKEEQKKPQIIESEELEQLPPSEIAKPESFDLSSLEELPSESEEKGLETNLESLGIEEEKQVSELEKFEPSSLEELPTEEKIAAEEFDISALEEVAPEKEIEHEMPQMAFEEEIAPSAPAGIESEEIPEEFIDLSLAASGIPIEHEIEHEKPHADYSNIEISDEDIHIIINTLKNYPAWLSNEVKNLILNDALSPSELEGLIDLLSNNVHWKAVMEYLKNTLNIDLSYHLTPEEKIYIPSLTEKLLPYIKWILGITFLSIVLFVIIFQFFIIPNQAQHYYKVAIDVLEKENNIEKAMTNFNIATDKRKYEKYYIIFGRLLLERNYFNQAEIIADAGIRNWPDNLAFYELKSDIYFIKGGTKNISESFRILEDLLSDKNFASRSETYEAIAKRYEKIGEYQQAINTYSEGLRHFQPTFNYLVKMLKNFIILKNYNAAADLYSKIDKKFKKLIDPDVFTKYSQFLLDVNKPFEAKEVIDKVLKYKPTFAPVYLPYAHYFEQMNQPEVALNGLLKAEKFINLGLYKESEEKVFDQILNEIGELYYDKNDDTLAYTYFEKSISENPNYAKAYYNIGRLNYFFYNRYEQALANLNKSLELGFSNDIQKYMIGWIQYHLKNFESALFSFLQLELEHLSNIDLKLAIGNSLIKFGKSELAIGYLSNYVSYWENMERQLKGRDIKNPKRQEAMIKLAVGYNNLGVAYALLSKEKKNLNYESEALRLFIRSQEIYNFLYPGRVSNAESYINAMYILHPKVTRDLLMMDNENYFPKMIF